MNWIKDLSLVLCILFGMGLSPLEAQKFVPSAAPTLSALAVSSDGRTAAAAFHGDTAVILFDLQTGLPRQRLGGIQQPVSFLSFAEDQSYLVAAGREQVTRWRLPDFQLADQTGIMLSDAATATGPDWYDSGRGLLYRSSSTAVYAISLRQGGRGKVLKMRQKESAGTAFLLTQAPDREVLWVLDPEEGELCGLELTHFRMQVRARAPDACALAAENSRVAVLCRATADSSRSAWRLELFDNLLNRQSVIPLELDLPAGYRPRLHFTQPYGLTITVPEGIMDVDLRSGRQSSIHWKLGYKELFYAHDGEIWLQQENALLQLDAWKRLQARRILQEWPDSLHDFRTGKRYRLTSDGLHDEQDRTVLSWSAQEKPVVAAVEQEHVALGFQSGAVALYHLPQRKLVWRLPADRLLPGRLCLSPEENRLAVQRDASTIELYNLADGNLIRRLTSDQGPILSMTFAQKQLVLGGSAGTLTFFDPEGGTRIREVQALDAPITALAYAKPAGYWLLGSRGETIACDTSCVEPQLRFRGHTGAIRYLTIAADGLHFYSQGDDGLHKTWELPTERLIHDGLPTTVDRPDWTIRGGLTTESVLTNLSFHPGGALLAARNTKSRRIQVWKTGSRQPLLTIPTSLTGRGASLHFFDDQEVLLVAGGAAIEYWDARTRQLLKRLDYPTLPGAFGEVVKETGQDVLWTYLQGSRQIVRLSVATGDISGGFTIDSPAGKETEAIKALVLSEDGRRMAVGATTGIYLYETENGRPLSFIPASEQIPGEWKDGIWIGPDNSSIAYRQGQEVAVFDTYQNKEVFRIPGKGIVFLDFQHLAVYRSSRQQPSLFDIWDYLRGEPVGTVDAGPVEMVADAANHVSSGRLVTAGPDGTLFWWRIQKPETSAAKKWLIPDHPGQEAVSEKIAVPVRVGKD